MPDSGRLTTHVLDTAHGKPAAGMNIAFSVRDGDGWKLIKTITTNADGRTDEARAGFAAFLAKEPAPWITKP